MRFWVVNTVRRVETRMNRAQAPERHRFSQTICGGMRLVRNQPQPLLEGQLKSFYDELDSLQKAGVLQVREGTPDGPPHDFMEIGLEWRRACAEARVEYAKKRSELLKAGDVEAAKALVLELPEEPEEFEFKEGLSMPRGTHEPSKAEAPAEEIEASPSSAAAGDEEDGGEDAEGEEAPDMSWTKAQLVEHAARVLPADPAELDDLTKRQILDKLEG